MFRWIPVLFLFSCLFSFAQKDQVWLHPNRGQWAKEFNYQVEVNDGAMFISPAEFAYQFHSPLHNDHDGETEDLHFHAVKSNFIGTNAASFFTEGEKSSFVRNYILGNDESKWRSDIASVKSVNAKEVYPGIELLIEGGSSSLKYSWIVLPSADPSRIKWKYSGQEKMLVNAKGELVITHSLGTITEGKPLVWTISHGKKRQVPASYSLNGDELTFALGDYNHNDTLIIDPSIVFSTFSGSTADNWGFTATPDPTGKLVGAGIVFGSGYPFVTGSYDGSFNGGSVDVAITKFNQNGSGLLYSTYLGGSGGETPNSIICAPNGELFVFGVTGSLNFPTSTGCFKAANSGGTASAANNITLGPPDLYIFRLSANGQNMLSSTYVGGTGIDGLNFSNLQYNYGDEFRGEIIVDATNVYVISSTNSTDFPLQSPSQGTMSGAQDAVIFKMNYQLSGMLWSTYYGGTGNETGHGIQLSSTGDVYITGGTSSPSLPGGVGFDLLNNGDRDAFAARLNGSTGAVIANTFFGTSEYDQGYFIQLDNQGGVYVYGQNEGQVPVTAGKYGNPNSGQFIVKYNPTLTAQLWTTSIGASTGHVEISPTAFLVSNCGDIYMSGWGGQINLGDQANHSTSNGFPVTSDAFQGGTAGSNFWIGVLGEDAAFLKYATFMGGTSSSYGHVDGGTSRFDKSGSIYHAVCGSCSSTTNGFTTTPGSWSPLDQSSNCNMACFKFDLNHIDALITEPDPLICLPDPVIFNNNSTNGNHFLWNFGDNTTSTEVNPTHLYAGPGEYTVTVIVSDSNHCYTSDTAVFVVSIGDFQGGIIQPAGSICPGEQFQFEAFGGANYAWSPANLLDDPTIFNPVATVFETTVFTCIISDSCGVDTVNVTLQVLGDEVTISNDTNICVGQSAPLFISGAASVSWSPATWLDDPTSATPVSTPENTITYTATGTSAAGCPIDESVTVIVSTSGPVPVMPDTITYCLGSQTSVIVSGGITYAWSPPVDISPLTGNVVIISSQTDTYYYCDFSNACETVRDSLFVDVTKANISAWNDTIVCPGEPAFFHASGGISYQWTPQVVYVQPNGSEIIASAHTETIYTVTGIDENGCVDDTTVTLFVFPAAIIQANADVYAFYGDEVQLNATSTTSGTFVWSPTEFLSCVNCESPVATPDQNFIYTVSYTDENGCSSSDEVKIIYDAIIYVPNAFTPGSGDLLNPMFFVRGGNINKFHMDIFNRWGELIFTSDSMTTGWDGTYEGLECQDGVYTWKIKYSDFLEEEHDLVGHVTLLR